MGLSFAMGRLCGAVLPIQFTINNNIALYTQKLADNNNLDRIIVNFAVILYKRSIQYGHVVGKINTKCGQLKYL